MHGAAADIQLQRWLGTVNNTFRNCMLISALTLLLASCSDQGVVHADGGRVEAENPDLAAFKASAPFTLSCTGGYNLTHEGETKQGSQSFKISINPSEMKAYMFSLYLDGSYSRSQEEMSDTIVSISNVGKDSITAGIIKIDRNTLKYTVDMATSGICKKASAFTSLPTRGF